MGYSNHDLYLISPDTSVTIVFTGHRVSGYKTGGKETLLKLACYNRKHSNLLLIITGPSSTVALDREEDSSSTKFFNLSRQITSQNTKKHHYYSLWGGCHTQTLRFYNSQWIRNTLNLHPTTHSMWTIHQCGRTISLMVIAVIHNWVSMVNKLMSQ